MAAALTRASAPRTRKTLKPGVVFELLIACLDFFTGQGAKTVYAEFLAAEAAHDRAVDHGAAQFGEIEIAVMGREAAAGQVADEAAGEGIAGAGGVEDVFQQIARHHEVLAAAEQDGAVFAALDDERVRTHFHDYGRGTPQIVFAGKLASLAIVDQQEVPLLQGLQQARAEIVDPVIHGVAAGELNVAHLAAHAALQIGLDIAQEEIRLGAVTVGQSRVEIGEHVEIGL